MSDEKKLELEHSWTQHHLKQRPLVGNEVIIFCGINSGVARTYFAQVSLHGFTRWIYMTVDYDLALGNPC